jgi:uncharacterized protein YjbI with pentapeptide repeats
MTQSLQNLVDRYKKKLLSIPNIQLTNMVLSDEVLLIPDMDSSFTRCMINKSELTDIKICNGNFDCGFFTHSALKNCIFENSSFQELNCQKCVFTNCSFIDCRFIDSEISETIFSNCKFEKGSLESSEFSSCEFIDPIFSDSKLDTVLLFTRIVDSKFIKFNKSIKFEGKFFLIDLLFPKNGIMEIFHEDWY